VPNWKEFQFTIEGKVGEEELTPLTLPMARLAEYLTDLAIIMGHKESIHFRAMGDGSARAIMDVDEEEESRVTIQIQNAARGEGPHYANEAYRRLDSRLRRMMPLAISSILPRMRRSLSFRVEQLTNSKRMARSTRGLLSWACSRGWEDSMNPSLFICSGQMEGEFTAKLPRTRQGTASILRKDGSCTWNRDVLPGSRPVEAG